MEVGPIQIDINRSYISESAASKLESKSYILLRLAKTRELRGFSAPLIHMSLSANLFWYMRMQVFHSCKLLRTGSSPQHLHQRKTHVLPSTYYFILRVSRTNAVITYEKE
jgi:hypothetical protein